MTKRTSKSRAALSATLVGATIIASTVAGPTSASQDGLEVRAGKSLTIITPRQEGLPGAWRRVGAPCYGATKCVKGAFGRRSPGGAYHFQAQKFASTTQAREYVRALLAGDLPTITQRVRRGVALTLQSGHSTELRVRAAVGRFQNRVVWILIVGNLPNSAITPPGNNAFLESLVAKARPTGGTLPIARIQEAQALSEQPV